MTWPFYGDAATGLSFLNHYFEGAPDNEVNDYLVENAEVVDLFTPDGFVAAQMIVRAGEEPRRRGEHDLGAGRLDLRRPKGTQTIRESDHAMLQPMFIVRLVEAGEGEYEAELVDALDPEATAPPES